jgi:cell division protein FtsL
LEANHLILNRSVASRSKTYKFKLLLIFLTPVLLASLYIWQRVTVITLSSQTKQLRVEIKQRQKALDYLEIEVAKLSSIDRLEKTIADLGFVRPLFDSIGIIQESVESGPGDTLGRKENIWVKLKSLQKNLFWGDKVEAKEIKHEH